MMKNCKKVSPNLLSLFIDTDINTFEEFKNCTFSSVQSSPKNESAQISIFNRRYAGSIGIVGAIQGIFGLTESAHSILNRWPPIRRQEFRTLFSIFICVGVSQNIKKITFQYSYIKDVIDVTLKIHFNYLHFLSE